ncbi:Leucine aminopeptidase 1 [Coemansia sp. Benny D115]|nr:Leucine aminopeptidase 1 [Coemansia sp. Benny D115]
MSETEIHALRAARKRFRDITDIPDQHQNELAKRQAVATSFVSVIPSSLSHQKQVTKLLPHVDKAHVKGLLSNFTSFTNRYYNSQNGKKSSDWLFKTIHDMAPGVEVSRFTHRFPQSSLIARINGTEWTDEIVILSAHQDSINLEDPQNGRAPGADDDGTGTVTILEALRIFVASGLRPRRSVEFHWYAGEEGGLLGSADVVKAYANKQVVADMQFDMTGYPLDPPAVGVVVDYTDKDTNALLRKLVAEYTDLPTKDMKCGYGCSDHASWYSRGVRSAMPFESDQLEGNTFIHSPKDSMDTVNFDHLAKFVNIALGFLIEVADAT